MSKVRKIEKLSRVALATVNPFPTPRRLKGSKAAGLAYERKFAKALPSLVKGTPLERHTVLWGQWLEFLDCNGKGFAQPDFFLLPPDAIGVGYILETKLSLNTRGWYQLEKLYNPLLSMLYPKVEWKLIQVCKNMRPGFAAYAVLDLFDPLNSPIPEVGIWHWTGF